MVIVAGHITVDAEQRESLFGKGRREPAARTVPRPMRSVRPGPTERRPGPQALALLSHYDERVLHFDTASFHT